LSNFFESITLTNKTKYMQQVLRIAGVAMIALVITACGAKKKDKKDEEISKTKAKIEKLKKEKNGLDVEIRQLEAQLAKLDPASAAAKARLVAMQTVKADSFTHYVDLQGKIDAENVAYVAPRGQGGVVKAIYVNTGSKVSKGQLILKLDDVLARQGVIAAQQQIGGIKAQLDQAQSIYERQQNLWKQNIGTEVQVLNAKTNVESLQSQLRAAEANVRMAQEQVNLSNVYAEISGVIDAMNIKVGEFFSPQSAANAFAGIRIINTNNLKVQINVPENYSNRIKEGSELKVTIPEANDSLTTRVSVVGKFIDPTSRSFTVEGKIPANKNLRANQVANVRIRDYAAANVISVPVNVIQTDEKGKYVFVAQKSGDKLVVRKRAVVVGEMYRGLAEIRSGLTVGEQILTEGYQTAYEGQVVRES
jgi:membrane fusion protein (multidrug efflux system)